MLEAFYPRECAGSVWDIPWEEWYARGMRGVIFDIDNTLTPHGARADERVIQLFAYLRKTGLQTCLLSNNQEPRVAPFAEAVQSVYICKADKPAKRGYRRAMEQMGTDPETTLFVGDQLFTDIWGANRCGIYAILVEPIHPKEEIQIVLKRRLEAVVLYFYRKREAKSHKSS
ncbi:MAG: YqeG family HAD IIIA-type phosphatase [Clostridiales bacterium]|nr:YqeG family HAD IIIA-type phosphatase [Clostridiales bacterium]